MALSHKRGHTKKIWLVQWAIFILRWEDQLLAVLCAKANKEFMRTVQQIVFLILNRVPGTFVTDPTKGKGKGKGYTAISASEGS